MKAALQQVPGLELERPIVFIDLETTGFNAREDRIVELACLRVHPNRQVGGQSVWCRLCFMQQASATCGTCDRHGQHSTPS